MKYEKMRQMKRSFRGTPILVGTSSIQSIWGASTSGVSTGSIIHVS